LQEFEESKERSQESVAKSVDPLGGRPMVNR
jgi:hypothetical protein